MSLMGIADKEQDKAEHWLEIEHFDSRPNLEPARQLLQRLDSILDELGRIDMQLASAFTRLRSQITTDTHDNLNASIAQTIEPNISKALITLADELANARQFTNAVIADPVNGQSELRAASNARKNS